MMQLSFTPFPVLTTQRLLLRKMTADDAPQMFFLRSDAGVLRYIGREPAKSVDEAAAFIEMVNRSADADEAINWGISLQDSPTLIGNICFWNVQKENYRSELGYVLHPDWQGKGLMAEALQAVLHYGFHSMGLHSVEAHVDPANTPSVRVLEQQGFVREAYFRECYYSRGQFTDAAVYGLLTPVEYAFAPGLSTAPQKRPPLFQRQPFRYKVVRSRFIISSGCFHLFFHRYRTWSLRSHLYLKGYFISFLYGFG